MADPSSSPHTLSSNSQQPESDNAQPDPTSTSMPPPSQEQQSSTSAAVVNPNSNPQPLVPPPAPSISSYGPPSITGPPTAPSFRPASQVPVFTPQFVPMNPNYQNPGVQPPGVSSVPMMFPGSVSGAATASVPQQMLPYQIPPGQPPNPAFRQFLPMPNGYLAMPGTMPPPGVPRYPSPYPAMVRPPFPPRPPGAMGVLPPMSRPPVPGIPGVRPFVTPVIRPAGVPSVASAEKPQTTLYVGKISPTVENDFMLSLLQLCGPVKSWKRVQNIKDGTPRGFGFCEFESAEGVLRALRLLNKFNIDGQELVLNFDQATKAYLERYVENSKKLKEAGRVNVDENAPGVEKKEPVNENSKKDVDDSAGIKENQDSTSFEIVTDEDRVADHDALEKLKSMIGERIKNKPLPPPPPPPAMDGSGASNSELPSKLKDGDSDVDITRSEAAEDKNDDESSDNKQSSEQDRPERSSPDRSRRYDRRSRDRERDVKREKEREIDRYEREAERERVRKDRELRRKLEDAEREYEERVKEWEYREREKEKQRQYEKDREKERERKRKKEIIYDEDEDDEDSGKRWRRSVLEEKRNKRRREKEDDAADRVKEEEEVAETQKRAEEEQLQQQQQIDALKLLSSHVINVNEKTVLTEELSVESTSKDVEQIRENHMGDVILQNGVADDLTTASFVASDLRQTGNASSRKLGFGLVGSGKRTSVPSVFHEEDDDDAHKEKKMRPLVPIDYSTEELKAVQTSIAGDPSPNLAAAAEFAKRISNANPKEDKPDAERERSRRSHDRSGHRDRDRNDEEYRARNEYKEKIPDRDREHGQDKPKTPDNKKLLDAKQLIDMIPKTKEELFSYEINWTVYDKHELHERMRPWISKKITEFLGEEETTLVDYIVSSTQEHVKASQMLELLQSILDDEAEMFVLKMWRMLIFEIKKVETGLSLKPKT